MENFRWVPDKSLITVTDTFDTLISQMNVGPEERKAISGPKKQWTLTFNKDRVDANEIWDFYIDMQGSFKTFLFRCPLDGKEYVVRFKEDRLSRKVLWRKVYEFGLELIEVYQE